MQEIFAQLLALLARATAVASTDRMYSIGVGVSLFVFALFIIEGLRYRIALHRPFIRRVERRWNARAVAVVALTAALSVLLQVLSSVIVVIPGTLTLRIDATVRHAFGAIFGLPAVWGTFIANILGDALSGTLGPGSLAGAIVSWLQAYTFYRLFDAREAAMDSRALVVRYYVGQLLFCVVGAFFLCTNFHMLGLLPPGIIWGVVFPAFMVSTFMGGLLGPVLARAIVPIARRYGLTRGELSQESRASVVPGRAEGGLDPGDVIRSSPAGDVTAAIEVRDLVYSYRGCEETPALRGVSFNVEEGTFLVVTGRTGAGKSTLCLALNGLIPQSFGGRMEGSVRVAGLDSAQADIASLARTVGIVQQNPESQITGLTVAEDVEFGLENLALSIDEIRTRAAAALATVGLSDLSERSPWQLSGGQKQRLAIAAALAFQPRILVLDNPTAELDPVGRADVLRTIARLNREQGITIVLVTQELHEAIPYADRLIVLDEGRVAADGAPASVLQEPARLRRLGVKLPDLIGIASALEACGRWAGPMPLTQDAAEQGIRRMVSAIPATSMREPSSPVTSQGDAIVRFEGVRFGYAGGAEILQGIDLVIESGAFVAVMGANGAGKTTIAKHLNGLLRPVSGRVLVDGKDTRQHTVAQMAASVGYVFQNPDHQIVCRHLGEELALGPVNCGWSPQRIEAATARVMQLFAFTDRDADPFFMGLAERNLVALATSLMMEPRILVLDEPATGADHGVITRLMTRVAELNRQGLTVIMVTHDAALVAEYAQRLVVVKDGRIALDGRPADVFRTGEAMYGCRIAPPPTLELCVRLANLGMPPFVSASQAIGALAGGDRHA